MVTSATGETADCALRGMSLDGIVELEAAIAEIPDPEIPVITIEGLGILRGISVDDRHATVTITPTYSGCPAMDHIRSDIERICIDRGFTVDVELVYAPAWTTDWMSEGAKDQLVGFGIAPPLHRSDQPAADVVCPQCASGDTAQISRFGSTACKALMVCGTCSEPFDYFKVL